MNNLCTDIGFKSVNKKGEQLCGDHIEIVEQNENSLVLVLADGLGSGVKACILSTLTSKIISTMIANNLGVEECVSTIAATLPVCEKRGVAYSTFTIIRITNNSEAEIIQYDNPHVIMLRGGENFEYPRTSMEIGGKTIYKSKLQLEKNDVFIAMSDGAIYAGVGKTLNFGWQRDSIIDFMVGNYDKKMSAKGISQLLLDECNDLYGGEPGDDTTVAAVKIRQRIPVSLMIGPPSNPQDLKKMQTLFFAKEGKHIVCGGTTSKLASEYLGKPVVPCLDYFDPDIPPIAKIEGIDLVTEGVVTMTKVLEYADSYLNGSISISDLSMKKDGASRIAQMLFEEATDISFYVGRAVNPAHQNPALPINFNVKMQLIDEVSKKLKAMGKNISVSYF
ncbi:MAG: serine/threonine-protein phosphatase [Oscillospiraceae bacterium]|nr:serine/threonine-protein phosphatase [Oscillospiraceae bacterium]MDE7278563.1 serine/threonine-protein phosphatase [Oscillospiraceae bacterium]